MKIAYMRQGSVPWKSTFGYEHTRAGLLSSLVEAGHEVSVFSSDRKKLLSIFPHDKFLRRLKFVNDFDRQVEVLDTTELLIMEPAERAIIRYWTNPPKATMDEESIYYTSLYRMWMLLANYSGRVGIIYNDPKCRAILIPESIALRYLPEPISHLVHAEKEYVVLTEANSTEHLVKYEAAWGNNTDMSAGPLGLKAFRWSY